jgi:hypothetical protein
LTVSCEATTALVVATPQAAAELLQLFVDLKGWRFLVVERFALVASDRAYVCDKQKDPETNLQALAT